MRPFLGSAHARSRRSAHAPTGTTASPGDTDIKMVDTVQIREVGPRDGFQNEPEVIPTERKIELIDALARTGVRRLEVTSFVRPDVIPQLADAAEVLARIDVPDGVAVSVLIPNERGLDLALALREELRPRRRRQAAFDEINVFLSASETHNRKNVNRSIAESLAGLERRARPRSRGGLALRGRDLDLVRLPLRGSRSARAGAGDRRAPARRGRAGDRVRRHDRDGEPAPGAGSCSRYGATGWRRLRADRAFPQHARSGSRQRAGGAAGRGRRASSRASASSAAAPCRRELPATSRPRISSRCWTRWESRPASTWTR